VHRKDAACRDVLLGLFDKTTLLYSLLFFSANLTVFSLSDDKIQALLKVIVCPLTKSPLKFDRDRCFFTGKTDTHTTPMYLYLYLYLHLYVSICLYLCRLGIIVDYKYLHFCVCFRVCVCVCVCVYVLCVCACL
jgi:hypothetical protein